MMHVEQMQRALYDLLPGFLPIASARAHLQQLKNYARYSPMEQIHTSKQNKPKTVKHSFTMFALV